jgi:hypothetical protein
MRQLSDGPHHASRYACASSSVHLWGGFASMLLILAGEDGYRGPPGELPTSQTSNPQGARSLSRRYSMCSCLWRSRGGENPDCNCCGRKAQKAAKQPERAGGVTHPIRRTDGFHDPRVSAHGDASTHQTCQHQPKRTVVGLRCGRSAVARFSRRCVGVQLHPLIVGRGAVFRPHRPLSRAEPRSSCGSPQNGVAIPFSSPAFSPRLQWTSGVRHR